jgi:hypothetical protein
LAASTLRRTAACDIESASLNKSDRRLVRTEEMEQRILAAR